MLKLGESAIARLIALPVDEGRETEASGLCTELLAILTHDRGSTLQWRGADLIQVCPRRRYQSHHWLHVMHWQRHLSSTRLLELIICAGLKYGLAE